MIRAKKGADSAIDGLIYFNDDVNSPKKIIVFVFFVPSSRWA